MEKCADIIAQTAVSIGIHMTEILTADSIAVITVITIIREKDKVVFPTKDNNNHIQILNSLIIKIQFNCKGVLIYENLYLQKGL